jgi:heat shock protein HtpX
LLIEEEMAPGAFAAGHHTIVVSRGLLEQTTEDELKGVLAHELGHLVSRDTVIASAFIMAGWLPGIIIYICRLAGSFLQTGFFISGKVKTSFGLLKIGRFSLLTGILFLLLTGYLLHRVHLLQAVVPVVAFALLFSILNAVFRLFYSWVSRFNEYRQDAYAHRLGFGAGLRQALYKLAANDVQPVNPFVIVPDGHHPVIYNRIRRLEKLEGLRA